MSDFKLELQELPQELTHSLCVQYAAKYMSSDYQVVLPEFYTWNSELPDVLCFGSRHSAVVEVKVSRSDFIKDAKKPFRVDPTKGMGDFRYYCCPKGLISKDEVPNGWGLLYVYPSGAVRMQRQSFLEETADNEDWYRRGRFPKDEKAEFHALFYYARRARYAGVHQRVLDYRGADK